VLAKSRPEVANLPTVGRLDASKRLDLAIALPLRNQDQLHALLQNLYNPASPGFHRYLSARQFAEQFGPTDKDYQALVAHVRLHGLRVTGTHPNRTLLDVNGTVAEIEGMFHVQLSTYQHPTEPRTFFAPAVDPSLDIVVPVLSVSGLDNFVQPRPGGLETNHFRATASLATAWTTGSGPIGNFLGRDFRQAYAPGVTLDGSGQAVGLFELDGYNPNDVADYENLAGQRPINLTTVLLDGFSGAPGGQQMEVALDIDMAGAMAPGLSNIIVYEGTVGNDILNRMATDNLAKQLSSSWHFGSQTDPAREQILQQFAAQGQSFFQASGDVGAYAGAIGAPSDDVLATVVGGTSLTMSNGMWAAETTWQEGSGGVSTSYAIPTWQQEVSMASNMGSTSNRNMPDVAALADNVIWVIVRNGQEGVIGGTSAAAPLWAGFTALVNQQATATGVAGPGYMNPALYAIGQGVGYAGAFHDIATGNNTNSSSPQKFFAVPGYDLCTGWGTPAGSNLISALVAPPDALAILPATGLAFYGPAGGPFQPSIGSWTLTNGGTGSLTWATLNTTPWLGVSILSGTLTAGGPVATVSLTLTAAANALPSGTYSAALFFTNLSDSSVQSRVVNLTVLAPNLTEPGVTMNTIYSFTGSNDGAVPNGLLLGNDGAFYGTTRTGGSNSYGNVFRMPTNGPPSALYAFTNGSDGATPFATLAQGADGGFYGATVTGGAYGNGTIYRVSSAGALTPLLAFNLTNGNLPYAALAPAGDSTFYGVCDQGGSGSFGIAYNVTTNGTLTILHSFADGSDGGQPLAGLLPGNDGNFYGTTYAGGTANLGTVFQLATNGTLSTLVSFAGGNGARPRGGLLQDGLGDFFGVTFLGGASSAGTIFELTAAGLLTNLYSFTGGSDGGQPVAGLTYGGDGNFYGTTSGGGIYGKGTVFRLTPAGTFTTLAQLDGFNGANPQAPLVAGSGGIIYGTTPFGGVNNSGTVFSLAVSAPLQINTQPAGQSVYIGQNPEFDVAVTGTAPLFWQWRKNNANLADGGTVSGSAARVLRLANVSLGDAGSYSVVISNASGAITSAPAVLTVISSAPFFVVQPTNQSPVPGTNAMLVGQAQGNRPLTYQWQRNGANLLDGGNVSGSATPVLTINNLTEVNNGTYRLVASNGISAVASSNGVLTVIPPTTVGTLLTTLYSFTGQADGGPPNALVAGTNGVIYGTTEFGHPGGTVFTVTTNGAVATLTSLASVGLGAVAALTQGSDGNFYGSTQFGGTNYAGDIFEMTPGGLLTNIYSFTGGSDGSGPTNALTLAADGSFWGTTTSGGASGNGNIYRITPAGSFTNVYSFTNGVDGFAPVGALTLGADGNFYGMTPGGIHSHGNIFRIMPSGTLTNLYSFTGGMDGSVPVGALALGSDGNFYGATKYNTIAGYAFYGTIFKVTTNGSLTTLYSLNYTDGAYPCAGLIQGTDGNFYGTTSTGNSLSNGTVYRITPGGAITTLVAFDGFDDGAHPLTPVVQGPDGALYGTTSTGGPGGRGTVYRLAFNAAPLLVMQPLDVTVAAGGTAQFVATYSAAPPVTLQWQFNGTNMIDSNGVSGSLTRVLTMTNVTLAEAGSYSLLITNAFGSAASIGANLNVIPGPAFQSVTVNQGTITFVLSTVLNHVYQLQSAPDLTLGNWTNLNSAVLAHRNTVTMTDVIVTNSQRYYRVEFVR
jgi:uncharacterized repeat protein (TIGR03803 family)